MKNHKNLKKNEKSLTLKLILKTSKAKSANRRRSKYRLSCYLSFGISNHAMPTIMLPESVPRGLKILVKIAVD